MDIGQITPDVTIAELLDNVVQVQTGATTFRKVRAYAAQKQPNEGLAKEFINVYPNGFTTAYTEPLGANMNGEYQGNLAIAIMVENMGDGTARMDRVRSIMSQVQALLHRRVADGFFFWITPDNIITPTTTSFIDGYSTTIINYRWRTSPNNKENEI